VPHLVQVNDGFQREARALLSHLVSRCGERRSGEAEVAGTVQECDNLIWLLLNLLRVYHFWIAAVHPRLDTWVLNQDPLVQKDFRCGPMDFGTKIFIFFICCTKKNQIRFITMLLNFSTMVLISGTKVSQQFRISTVDIGFVPEASADACNCKLLQLHNCS
jgi:hypothetical protein